MAIGLAAAAIVSWGQVIYNSLESNEEAARKTEEAIANVSQTAGEAVDKLSSKYENLKTALSDLDSSYDALENMTKGTEEWSDAVFELNQKVLELADNYDKLVVEFDADGVAHITEESKKAQQEETKAKYEEAVKTKTQADTAYNQSKVQTKIAAVTDIIGYDKINTEQAVKDLANSNLHISDSLSDEQKIAFMQEFSGVDGATDKEILAGYDAMVSSNDELIKALNDAVDAYKEADSENSLKAQNQANLDLQKNQSYNNTSSEESKALQQKMASYDTQQANERTAKIVNTGTNNSVFDGFLGMTAQKGTNAADLIYGDDMKYTGDWFHGGGLDFNFADGQWGAYGALKADALKERLTEYYDSLGFSDIQVKVNDGGKAEVSYRDESGNQQSESKTTYDWTNDAGMLNYFAAKQNDTRVDKTDYAAIVENTSNIIAETAGLNSKTAQKVLLDIVQGNKIDYLNKEQVTK